MITRQTLNFAAGVIFMAAWILYWLYKPLYSEKGFFLPSPDGTMNAVMSKGHRTYRWSGKEENYYRITVSRTAGPFAKFFDWHLFNETLPLSAADESFKLRRDCIRWNMDEGSVTFDFGKTRVKKVWRNKHRKYAAE